MRNLDAQDLENLSKEQLVCAILEMYEEVKDMRAELDRLIAKFDSLRNGYKSIVESESYKNLQERKKY